MPDATIVHLLLPAHSRSRKNRHHHPTMGFFRTPIRKRSCDRITTLVKRQVKLYVAENHKCTNPSKFLKCTTSTKHPKSTIFIESQILPFITTFKIAKLPGISSYFNFEFNHQTSSVKVWKAYKIGAGKTYHSHHSSTASCCSGSTKTSQ